MKTLKRELLTTFMSMAIAIVVAIAAVLWWKLDESIRQQSDLVAGFMKSEVRATLDRSLRTFGMISDDLLNHVGVTADAVSHRQDIITFVRKSQPEPLNASLSPAAEKHGVDIMAVFDLDGILLASSRGEVDDIEASRHFQASEIGRRILDLVAYLTDGAPQAVTGYLRLDPEFLRNYGLQDRGIAGRGALGMVSARIVIDEFGDPLGFLFVGKILNRYTEPLEKLQRLTKTAFVTFFDTVPIASAGFPAAVPVIDDTTKADIEKTGRKIISLVVGTEAYVLDCTPLRAVEGQVLGVRCAGITEAKALEAEGQMAALGYRTRNEIQKWFVIIAGGSLAGVILLSLVFATRISKPLVAMTSAMTRLADNELDTEIPMPRQSSEIASMAEAMQVFKDNAVERARAEGDLRESEERYRRLVELSPDGILVHRQGGVIFANAAAARLLGADGAEDLVGRSVVDLCHPDYRDAAAARRRMVEEQGLTVPPMEQVWFRLDGQTFVVESSGTPVTYEGQTVILAVFRDITERKRAEEALRESEERFRAIVDNSPAIVSLKDKDGRYLLVNRQYERELGVSADQVIGRMTGDVLPPDHATLAEAHTRAVISTGTVVEREEELTIQGEKRVYRTVKFPVFDSDGNLKNIGSIATNVTEHKRAERERLEKEQWFRAVVDNSPTAIFLKDPDSRYLMVNKTYADWYNIDPETVQGMTPGDIYLPEVAEQILANDRRVVETGWVMEREIETESVLKDGTNRTVMVVKFPILDADGKVIAIGVIQADISDRRRAEEAMRTSEGRLRGAVESLQEGFALFDADDRLVIMNAEYNRLNPFAQEALDRGLRYEDVLRKNVERGVILDAVGREEEFIRERVGRHHNPGGEIIRQFADGSWYILKEARTPEGGIALSFIEITELKKIEQALRQSEERLLGAVENLQEGFALYDADDRLVMLNEEYRRLQPGAEDILVPGMPFEDLMYRNVENRIITAAIGREKEYFRERLEHHRNPTGPIIRELSNGTWYIIKEARTPDGGIVVSETDITELKHVEEALRGSEERFRSLIEGSIQGVLINRNFVPLFVNQAFADMFGYSGPEEIVALGSVLELNAPHERDRMRHYHNQRVIGADAPGSYEYQGVRKDGTVIWLENRVSVVSWEEAPAVLMTVVDITEHKHAEEDSRRHQDELAHVWRLSAMGEMATSLAHELNQPISAISTYTQGCVDKLRSPRVKPKELLGALVEASEQAERAGAILRRIRNFVRKKAPEQQAVNINDAIADVTGLVQAEARRYDVSVQLQLADDLPPVFVDPIQVQQVILNLTRNGIEAIGGTSSVIRDLVIGTALGNDGTVSVSVRDSGVGVPGSLLDRVFEPFFTTKANGLGMGLSISRSIIEAHGGRLWATSDAHGGTVFQIALPVGEEMGEVGRDDARAHSFHR